MFAAKGIEKRVSVFLDFTLLRGVPIRPVVSILHDNQSCEREDQGFEEMAEKIKQTEKELSHATNR